MLTFNQWWEQNKKSFDKTIGNSGDPVYSRREVAHAAWVYGSLSLSHAVNQAVEEILKEATHEI